MPLALWSAPARVTFARLAVVGIFAAAPLSLYACAGTTTTACAYTPDDTPKVDPLTVFRAKSLPCFTDTDCRAATITPRCSAPELARCDKSQPSTKKGICVFQLTGTSTTCNTCYEGDIRYCDTGSPGSCTAATMSGCGIQTCAKDDDGGIPPASTWKVCVPLSTLAHTVVVN